MSTLLRPSNLLLFDHSLADDLIHIGNLVHQLACLPLCFLSPLLKSGGTAAVLWRSGTAAPDAHRIRPRLLWRDELLNSHLVFPVIGKVILVQKAFIHAKVEID